MKINRTYGSALVLYALFLCFMATVAGAQIGPSKYEAFLEGHYGDIDPQRDAVRGEWTTYDRMTQVWVPYTAYYQFRIDNATISRLRVQGPYLNYYDYSDILYRPDCKPRRYQIIERLR